MSSTPTNINAPEEIGQLCSEGQDIATYLFQVPNDPGQRKRVREILDTLAAHRAIANRKEFPQIVAGMKAALDEQPSMMAAESLQDGFDRLNRLWQSAKSGLF